MESSQTRNWTHVPCIGRWILNHWTTRGNLGVSLKSKLWATQGWLKMWGSGPTDLLALVLWATQALCHQMTCGKGNSSEQGCLLQVQRAVRQVWETQEVAIIDSFTSYVFRLDPAERRRDITHQVYTWEGSPSPRLWLPQQWKEYSLGKVNLSSHSCTSLSPRWETYQVGTSDDFILWYLLSLIFTTEGQFLGMDQMTYNIL